MAGDKYDVILGIRRGGSIVCDAFCRHFPKSAFDIRCDVSLQRPSTKRKSAAFGKLLRFLPYPVLNLLRIAEAKMLELRSNNRQPPALPDARLPHGLKAVLENEEHPKILIIDDAIDSGNTLYAVKTTLMNLNPLAQVKVAVITVTSDHTRVKEDFTLYHNRTLIRFPWSSDYKK